MDNHDPAHSKRSTTWFQRVTWVPLAANLGPGIPARLATERMMAFAGMFELVCSIPEGILPVREGRSHPLTSWGYVMGQRR